MVELIVTQWNSWKSQLNHIKTQNNEIKDVKMETHAQEHDGGISQNRNIIWNILDYCQEMCKIFENEK